MHCKINDYTIIYNPITASPTVKARNANNIMKNKSDSTIIILAWNL